MIKNWNIKPESIVAIVTDNGPNIVSAFKNTPFPPVYCAIHTIGCIVKDVLKSQQLIQALLSKLRGIVMHFKKSSCDKIKYSEMQNSLNMPIKKLKQSKVDDTRYFLKFYMKIT